MELPPGDEIISRCLTLTLLLLLTLSAAACSFSNSFLVVNSSARPIEVLYKIKKPSDPRAPSRLSEVPPYARGVSGVTSLEPLPADRYKIDPDRRTVALTLNPGESLMLDQCKPANMRTHGDCVPGAFSVEELYLSGADGEISLKGEQVRMAFVNTSNNEYILTYK
ncbi:MAG: hypothetical protein ACJ741_20765 [Pyrinomonadaceae bacterium]